MAANSAATPTVRARACKGGGHGLGHLPRIYVVPALVSTADPKLKTSKSRGSCRRKSRPTTRSGMPSDEHLSRRFRGSSGWHLCTSETQHQSHARQGRPDTPPISEGVNEAGSGATAGKDSRALWRHTVDCESPLHGST